MFQRLLIAALCGACMWGANLGTAWAGVAQLPISADYCAILRAFQVAPDPSCPAAPQLGATRSLGAAATQGAVPPGDPSLERGYFIRFAFNSKDLTPEYKDHLARLAAVFQAPQTQELCFLLVGHTDSVGSAGYNLGLSNQRARTVHLYLAGVAGVPPERLRYQGRGEAALLPEVPGTHGLNRRVEILAKPMEQGSCPH